MNNLTYGDVSHGSTCSPSSPSSSVFNSSSSNLFLRSSTSFLKLFQLQKKQLLSTEWRVPSVTTYSFWFGSASNDSNLGLSFSLSSRRLLRLINPPIIDLNKIAANSQMFTTEDKRNNRRETCFFYSFCGDWNDEISECSPTADESTSNWCRGQDPTMTTAQSTKLNCELNLL